MPGVYRVDLLATRQLACPEVDLSYANKQKYYLHEILIREIWESIGAYIIQTFQCSIFLILIEHIWRNQACGRDWLHTDDYGKPVYNI